MKNKNIALAVMQSKQTKTFISFLMFGMLGIGAIVLGSHNIEASDGRAKQIESLRMEQLVHEQELIKVQNDWDAQNEKREAAQVVLDHEISILDKISEQGKELREAISQKQASIDALINREGGLALDLSKVLKLPAQSK